MKVSTASRRLVGGVAGLFKSLGGMVALNTYDAAITLANVFTPKLSPQRVGPTARIDELKNIWPEYRAPEKEDSRSPCPALNAMANHGIIPRDGKNIPFTDLSKAIRQTYNFSATFSRFVPQYAAKMLGRDYFKDSVDLADLCVHNGPGIEHDASLTRLDAFYEPDQSIPHNETIDRLLACASGKDKGTDKLLLTNKDVARFSHIRRTECKKINPQFTLDTMHKVFGSNNSATMTVIFGGKLDDLDVWLKEERLPENWVPARRDRYGVSIASFNKDVFDIELSIPNTPYVGSSEA